LKWRTEDRRIQDRWLFSREGSVTPLESAFDWLEHTGLSLWVRGDSLLAFPLIISAHTLGMGFLAGTNSAIGLRILGVAKRVPLAAMEKFYPIIWVALAVNFVSGTLLFLGYPWKAVTNPVFYMKLSFIALAVFLAVKVRAQVLCRPSLEDEKIHRQARLLAMASIGSWAAAILCGRLLAYTYTWLHPGVPGGF